MLQDFLFKRKCDNFEDVKTKCIQHFDQFRFSFCNQNQKISNTDWHLNQDVINVGAYFKHLKDPIESHLAAFCDAFGYKETSTKNIWFQQYLKGDYHCIHTHGDCNFSNVLYLELPDNSLATKFYFKGEQVELDVSEGDIISFPSFLAHESPINISGKRKTIVSFNSHANMD